MLCLLCRHIQDKGLDLRVGLIGLVKDLSGAHNMTRLLQSGVSRVSVRLVLMTWVLIGLFVVPSGAN